MRIQVIGAGVVGLATGDGLSRLGHDVVFYDISSSRLASLREMGFSTTDEMRTDCVIDFICVPEDQVEVVVQALLERGGRGLFVVRSTVPVGATVGLGEIYGVHVCHNPEFLREATALHDFLNPSRVVIGECCVEHGNLLEGLYKPLGCPVIRVNSYVSEVCKLVSNAHLSTLVSFWNEVHLLCGRLGVNSHIVGRVVALDPRVSEYGAHRHGRRFGGGCLPKDLDALIKEYKRLGLDPHLLFAVKRVNEELESR